VVSNRAVLHSEHRPVTAINGLGPAAVPVPITPTIIGEPR